MMYFTETAWTLPEMWEVNEAFERDYDQASYETKMGGIARRARAHAAAAKELGAWKEAVRVLEGEDHYLLVLLAAHEQQSSDSLLVDRLRLLGTALLMCVLLIAAISLWYAER